MLRALGEKLRAAREARGLTLDDVAQATRIRARYLAAIEAGELDSMSSSVQARGFLRNYAHHVGLDPYQTLIELDAALEEMSVETDSGISGAISRKRWPVPVFVLVGIAILGGVITLVGSANTRNTLPEIPSDTPTVAPPPSSPMPITSDGVAEGSTLTPTVSPAPATPTITPSRTSSPTLTITTTSTVTETATAAQTVTNNSLSVTASSSVPVSQTEEIASPLPSSTPAGISNSRITNLAVVSDFPDSLWISVGYTSNYDSGLLFLVVTRSRWADEQYGSPNVHEEPLNVAVSRGTGEVTFLAIGTNGTTEKIVAILRDDDSEAVGECSPSWYVFWTDFAEGDYEFEGCVAKVIDYLRGWPDV